MPYATYLPNRGRTPPPAASQHGRKQEALRHQRSNCLRSCRSYCSSAWLRGMPMPGVSLWGVKARRASDVGSAAGIPDCSDAIKQLRAARVTTTLPHKAQLLPCTGIVEWKNHETASVSGAVVAEPSSSQPAARRSVAGHRVQVPGIRCNERDHRALCQERSAGAPQEVALPHKTHKTASPGAQPSWMCLFQVVVVADGQVTRGSEVVKPNVRKVRRLGDGKVIGGFAGVPMHAGSDHGPKARDGLMLM